MNPQSIACFEKAFSHVTEHPATRLDISSLTGAASAFAARALACHPPKNVLPLVLAITPGVPEADTLTDDLAALVQNADVRILPFPPTFEGDVAALSARLKVSAALGAYRMRPHPLIITAPFAALAQGVADSSRVLAATVTLSLETPAQPGFSTCCEKLSAAGYTRVAEVTERGTFARRGGVVDVWSPNAEQPIRAEFFGEDLESLRCFDPATQTSVAKCDTATFEAVTLGEPVTRLLAELLPPAVTVLALEHTAYHLPENLSKVARIVYTGNPAPRDVLSLPFETLPLPGLAELGATAARQPELLDAARLRLEEFLTAARKRGDVLERDDNLSLGFSIPGLVVVSRADRIFAARRKVSSRITAHTGERLSETADLEIGEYVVHVDYGIGRFMGSTEIEVDGKRSEVFTIEYADGGRLHVPVAHVHLLSRYIGVRGEQVKMHRLDGKRWSREKAGAQASVRDLAAALLETQARRAAIPGFACRTDLPEITAFEDAFPYEETPDQAAAIKAVREDLALPKPMDRLICGDAGYGKTEVAMRAAFIMAVNGRQCVLLAPTTVLAEQHYETFLARFEGTPIRIEAMSRFQSRETRAETRDRLASGATDIVIGTHAVLSERIHFHDLGLIIIDEEQRFGVRHKEFLKRLRTTADVLTLSATPIPRTLYLSMTGMRDLSVLRTPPRERVAVETLVVRDSDERIRHAILRERARGGQTYFLHNRVSTLDRVAQRLRALVPDLRFDYAHGQMPTPILAEKMRRFSRGDTELLLCTSIVESGLDIPRANTILVNRADCFGLAELYQLRGRVGRSSQQGYAIFLLPEESVIDAEARERLAALQKHAGLGAGFNLALRDLEIRGAGNLLGREQSGHIAAVGFQLYCQLLQRTVARLKGEQSDDLPLEVSVNLDFLDFSPASENPDAAASLPYNYVEDEAQRMEFHRRLAETRNLTSVRKLRAELADRYGKLPKSAIRLIRLVEFRVRCAEKHIVRVDVKGDRAFFYQAGSATPVLVRPLTGKTPDRRLNGLFRILSDYQQAIAE